ncbi:FUSC family protein [Cobetia sp. ICG0124]|uniref:FUSC family protein n=1 Tax=Cobetia sp. ICG0124 TaxID=2053669 RepID=UPI000FD8F762|nr:FUSC family protein [Cobetia sp. ICG0124]AZV30870.1 FUSC family protein [Cobetia sp. ICG0124]
MNWLSHNPYFTYLHRQRLHILRVTVALTLCFSIIELFDLPHSSWALVSTVMVMGNLPHVGGVLDKGSQRLLGTLLGGLWGLILILVADPLPGVVPIWSMVGIALALNATFSNRYGYSSLLFCVTLLMVVGDGNHDLGIALWRVFNVVLGTLISIVVSLVLLPQKATDVFRFLLADNLDKLARLYHNHTNAERSSIEETLNLVRATSAQLVKQRGLVDAVVREGRIQRGDIEEILSFERRMISTIELLQETHWNTREGHEFIEGLEGLRDAQHRLARALGTLAFQVRTGQHIELTVTPFDLQRYAEVRNVESRKGRALFSPAGYLWLNRELARLTEALGERLSLLERLPSERLQRRLPGHGLISDARRIFLPEDPTPGETAVPTVTRQGKTHEHSA